MVDNEKLIRWRLILGSSVKEQFDNFAGGGLVLNRDYMLMDDALAAIYDDTESSNNQGGKRSASLGKSSPAVAKWLGDVRSFFPEDVVSVIQRDAIEKKGLTQLLFEPEVLKNVKPDIQMVATLMSLRGRIPERTKDTARELVKAVVDEITKKLEREIRSAVTGALNKRNHSPIPSLQSIDWKYTINRNLKNYNNEINTLIPDRIFYFDRGKRTNNWTIILDMDQSGSMADSVIYGSIIGSIFASIPTLKTHVVAFDTEVVDLTEQCGNDPVEMLFGIQLGGGTDINKSVAYCQKFITDPSKTIFVLLTDLYEGGNQAGLIRRMTEIYESGVKAVCLLALSDSGTPGYDETMARKLTKTGIPCFACTPTLLPEFLEGVLKGYDLDAVAEKVRKK
jgi:hypothetical protein